MLRKFEINGKNETLLGIEERQLFIETIAALQELHHQTTNELDKIKKELKGLKKVIKELQKK